MSCRVIYDLWNEVYKLEIVQVGSATIVTATPTLEGVLRRCAEVPLRLSALAALGIAWWLRARRTGSEDHRADGR